MAAGCNLGFGVGPQVAGHIDNILVTVLTELLIYPPSNKHIQTDPFKWSSRTKRFYRACQVFGCSYPSSVALPVSCSKLSLLLYRTVLLFWRKLHFTQVNLHGVCKVKSDVSYCRHLKPYGTLIHRQIAKTTQSLGFKKQKSLLLSGTPNTAL